MTLELRFFHECDHVVKSEPLIIDEFGVAETRAPMTNSALKILEENVEIKREPIIRSDTDDVDSLAGPIVTNIDLVVQELLHKGELEIKKFRQSRDFMLTSQNLILWKDTAESKPHSGQLYYVNYRISRSIGSNFRMIDSFHVKISKFDRRRSYVMDYSTLPEFCTKCQSSPTISGVDGLQQQPSIVQDIVYGPTGDFLEVQGVEKLKQDMIRAILAIRGSNPREPFYGTSIEKSIGTGQASDAFESLLAQEVRSSLGLMSTLQKTQARVQSNVDPNEILDRIIEIRLLSDNKTSRNVPGQRSFDPTMYSLSVVVQSAANNLVDFFVPMDVFSRDANPADVSLIQISNVIITDVMKDSAVITWRSNIETDSIVDFGENDDLSNRELGNFGINHLVTLTGLKPATLYYFKVVTRNRGFLFGSELRSLKTLP